MSFELSSKNQHKSMTKEIKSLRFLLLGVKPLLAGAAMLPLHYGNQ